MKYQHRNQQFNILSHKEVHYVQNMHQIESRMCAGSLKLCSNSYRVSSVVPVTIPMMLMANTLCFVIFFQFLEVKTCASQC